MILCSCTKVSYCSFEMEIIILIVVLLSSASSLSLNQNYTDHKSPIWLGSIQKSCQEIRRHNTAIKCHTHPSWYILHCYCITEYNKNHSVLVTGLCPYTCSKNLLRNGTKLPRDKNITQIAKEQECGPSNRIGQLCGNCIEDYAPAVYSYSNDCYNCTNYKWNWLRYMGVAYGPQTIFFIIIVFTKTSVTSGWMVGYVTISQLTATSIGNRFRASESREESYIIKKVFPVWYGIWNLDFFKDIYSPFCVHPSMTTLSAISMDYTVALYPLVLLIFTFILIEGFTRYTDKRTCCITVIKVRHSYHKLCDFRGSVIDAFATVMILSYVKILNTSIEILLYTPLVNLDGEKVDLVVYYNGSMEYLGKEHLPYAFLSLIMMFTFNILPLLIITLYPFQCFQNFLNKRVSSKINLNTVHMVMDVFYRSYKLKKRSFAVFYVYIRLILFLLLFVELSPVYLAINSIIVLFSAVILGLARPHKLIAHNIINCFFLCLLGIINIHKFLDSTAYQIYPNYFKYYRVYVTSALYLVLPLYFFSRVMRVFVPSFIIRKISKCWQRIVTWTKNKHHGTSSVEYVNIPISSNYNNLLDVND